MRWREAARSRGLPPVFRRTQLSPVPPDTDQQKGMGVLNLTNEQDVHRDQRLRSEQIIWLGSTRPDGRPHTVPVWFDWDGQTVLILSQPDNQKVKNLRHDPRVTLHLETVNDGSDIIILEGTAELLAEPASEVVSAAYLEKYAVSIPNIGFTPESMVASYSQAIRVMPTRFISW